ncbi:hypothetical protein CYY_001503 [Polysphondylium violaceum]|uniref:Uncharacterized protein n=1 Tax=Polysphondylium violaceum TaxID=133409 RepID=A0A8J4Q1U9_9MYCE|nr:hypothetical protein CYY_001503 [Polysphondylium violaceum]
MDSQSSPLENSHQNNNVGQRFDSVQENTGDLKDIEITSQHQHDVEKGVENNFNSPPFDQDGPEAKKYSRFHPHFYTQDHLNETKIIIASMSFKFAFETFSSALGLLVLTRFDDYGVTLLAVMNIVYFISQSIGSVLVGPFVRSFRASRVTSFVLFFMAILISILIIVEACTGGTLDKLGSWNKWLITPVYLLMGLFLGMVEVSRKLTPRQVLGNNNAKLSKLNGLIHLFYEASGTAGAFLSTLLISKLGPIYALIHQPIFFLIGSILFFSVSQPFPPSLVSDSQEINVSSFTLFKNRFKNPIVRAAIKGSHEVYLYFHALFVGARHILSREYWWIITTYVLPQVLHRLLENLLFPTFAKKVLNDGSLSGILTGGSNMGEAVGSLMVVKFGRYVKNPLWWVRADGLFCNLLWILVYPPKLSSPSAIAWSMVPIWVVVSSSWAAGDISLLSFIQSQFPLNVASQDHHKKEEEQDKSETKNEQPAANIDLENPDRQISDVEMSTIGSSTNSSTESLQSIHHSTTDAPRVAPSNQSDTSVEDLTLDDTGKQVDISDEDDPPPGSPLASVIGFLFALYAIIISLLSFGLGRTMDHFINQGDTQRGFFYIAGVGFTVCGGLVILSSFFAMHKELRKL